MAFDILMKNSLCDYSALKISVPAYTTSFDTLESSDELNIQSNEGWLQFLN